MSHEDADRGGWRRAVLVAAGIAVLGAVVGAVTSGLWDRLFGSEPGPPPPAGQISAPGGGREVPSRFTARGSVSNIPRDKRVWLTIRVGRDLYPVAAVEGPERGRNGWNETVDLLGRAPTGLFSLTLLLVSDAGDREIERRRSGRNVLERAVSGSRTLYEVGDLRVRRCSRDPIRTGSLAGAAQISSVVDHARVPRSINPLVGEYRLPPGSRASVWILVYAPVVDRFYPQSHRDLKSGGDLSATLLAGGRFRSSAGFGGRPGERYEVIGALAGPAASAALSRTLRAGDFGGLTARQLPAGLDEKSCVQVQLRG
jgi:hypothetical protein